MKKIKPAGKVATCESGDAFRGFTSAHRKDMSVKMRSFTPENFTEERSHREEQLERLKKNVERLK